MEFHVSRQARDRYSFDQALYSLEGNIVFANFPAARVFAQKINDQRDLIHHPERVLQAGAVHAMGLIDEILHMVVAVYREQINAEVTAQAVDWLYAQIGRQQVDAALRQFAAEFPARAVYLGDLTEEQYWQGTTEGRPNPQVVLEEMVMLWLANKNPAFSIAEDLFSDAQLSGNSVYPVIMAELYRYFETQPRFGPENQNLIDLLRTPAVKFPNSLFSQLDFIREQWLEMLGDRFGAMLRRLLAGIDFIREEEMQRGFGGGPGPIPVPTYTGEQAAMLEVENFSPDQDWMPRLVLMAKTTYVWLDQLSKVYGRSITRLDQIPDEELQKLASWGFTGLWLIGLWERSRASAQIKQIMGNPEAIASAYSLYDYSIAADLGGDEAYNNLRERAWRYGIRLASDMVPNHMGIDSRWVADHPDWFLSLDYSPFPSYTFNSADLSSDGRVSVMLEDHYYTRSDAAVVFKLYDHRNGRERYVYHGNDGTTIPWNDTAQLNYLMPEVREAVIQTILSVARRFPIIRFDAAMTLAKLHYQRLWFPQPGSGGAIPSRAEFGMTKEQFDALMPVEFWREVVDRAAVEAPDTLLLAEAFWMMEGYFVRTLGMHRVYNSAFMNILRDEDNAKYRLIMKNTLEFDPEILKRYVNFMNNPDERTAVDQFGKGEKYFGIAALMATMPGLPMFGHGQIEGFSEKYGMEFKRAYWDEVPDQGLIDHHKAVIFPLLHRRAVFAGVENFLLYDFYTQGGGVDENVFAYSNGLGSERGLVVYHNKFGETSGWVRISAAYAAKGPGAEKTIIQRSLAEGLNLHDDPRAFVLMRDVMNGLEYIRSSQDLVANGLFLSLKAYTCCAFIDIREVQDDEWGSYRRVHEALAGQGVPSVQNALQELLLQPVVQPVREILNPGYFQYLLDNRLKTTGAVLPAGLLAEADQKFHALIDRIGRYIDSTENRAQIQQDLRNGLRLALALPVMEQQYPVPASRKYAQAVEYLQDVPGTPVEGTWALLFGWLFLRELGLLAGKEDDEAITASWLNEWTYGRIFGEVVRGLGLSSDDARQLSSLLRVLVDQQRWFTGKRTLAAQLTRWLSNSDIQHALGVHRFEDVLWFNRERFNTFVWWMTILSVFEALSGPKGSTALLTERVLITYELAQRLLKAADASGYQVDKLLEQVQPTAKPAA